MKNNSKPCYQEQPSGERAAGRLFAEVAAARLRRRGLLAGLGATLGWRALAPSIAALANLRPRRAEAGALSSLTFPELRKGRDGTDHVAPGYRAEVLIRWGDPVTAGALQWAPDRQSAEAQAQQFGQNNDFIAYFPLPRGSAGSEHGLLCVNHEFTRAVMMFSGVRSNLTISRAQAEIEMAAHGISVIEVRRAEGRWRVVGGSPYGRRITAGTSLIALAGPAAGHPRLRTSADPSGRWVTGTLNNCAGGVTPWGTLLSSEENFNLYFTGDGGRTAEAVNHRHYGVGSAPRFGWARHFARFRVEDEPTEANRFGWVVELDPHDPNSTPKKRTALGRLKHEGATVVVNGDRRVVVYCGDDGPFEHIYRFVSARRYDPDHREANRDLLDSGRLSVARFDDDGKLTWLPMIWGEGPLTPANGFAGPADVLIEARRAAKRLGATAMDRPEDVETNPVTGRVYVALTNNVKRTSDETDASNPRGPNRFGHILEMIPPADAAGNPDHAGERYRWEILLLAGNPRRPAAGARYNPAVSDDGWLMMPDNFAFDPRGRLWIATDGASKRGGFADGLWACDLDGPGRALTRHFYHAPIAAEVSGPCFTPDGRTLFLSVQHPGSDFYVGTFDAPLTRWPDFVEGIPPRPAVVAITKDDGGVIGS